MKRSISILILILAGLVPAFAQTPVYLRPVATTSLNGDLAAAATRIEVSSTAGFPTRAILQIGTEVITCTSKQQEAFLGCVRGANGTTAASYISGTTVFRLLNLEDGTGSRQAINAVRDYGCTGLTTDEAQACLQAAITASESLTSREVYVPAGIYKVKGLTSTGPVSIVGDGVGRTIIYSVTNAPILDMAGGTSGWGQFRGGTLRNLTIRGDVNAGSNQVGLKVSDPTYALGFRVENVTIEDTGGSGLLVDNAFSSVFDQMFITNTAGYPVEYDGENMPTNEFRSIYVGNLRDSAPIAFRIRSGDFVCHRCNGINSVPEGSIYAVVGQMNGYYGDTTNKSAQARWVDTNFESFGYKGVVNLYASWSSFEGKTTFARHVFSTTLTAGISDSDTTLPVGDTTGFVMPGTVKIGTEHITCTGKTATSFTTCTRGAESTSAAAALSGATVTFHSQMAVEYILDDSLLPQFFGTAYIDDTVNFGDDGGSAAENAYHLNSAIHSSNTPPLLTRGKGASQNPGNATEPIAYYYDTGTSQRELLRRADGMQKRITLTAGRTFSRPGVRQIEANFSAAGAIVLPWPGWYRTGETITVVDVSGSASTNNITITAGGGATINGAGSYVIAVNRQSVTFSPNNDVTDWRVVSVGVAGTPAEAVGTLDYYAVWTNGNTLSSGYLWKYTPGGANYTVSNEHFIFGSNNTKDVGAEFDNRPRAVYAGTEVRSPKFGLNSITHWTGAAGSPEGAVTADPGSIYSNTSGGAGTTFYVKESGSGNTGWVGIGSGGGSYSGTGSANRLTIWSGATSFTSVSGLEWDSGNLALTVPGNVWAGNGSAGSAAYGFGPTYYGYGMYFEPTGTELRWTVNGTQRMGLNATDLSTYANITSLTADTYDLGLGGYEWKTGRFATSIILGLGASKTGEIQLKNSTNSNTLTIKAGATSSSYTITMPTGAGSAGECVMNSGTPGIWTTGSCGSGATTALDNLASVAINTSLISDTDVTDDLGSSSIAWRDLFISHVIGAGSAPTVSEGTGAGISPSSSLSGTDLVGVVSVTTGLTPSASATVIEVTTARSFGGAGPTAVLTPANSAAAALSGNGQVFVDDGATLSNKWVVKVGSTALAASTTYVWIYHVLQ